MTRRTGNGKTAVVNVDGNIVVVRGWKVAEALRDAGLRPLFLVTAGGWCVDGYRLPDVLAGLSHAGYRVRVDEGLCAADPTSGGDR